MVAEAIQPRLRERNRQLARDTVLDAAERLLGRGETAEFSMRALAAEAGVGFATPFNHFGSKNAIMQALSSRLIGRMAARFRQEAPAGDAIDRALAMGRIGVAHLLEKPGMHKALVGSLGVATPVPGAVRQTSRELWSLALGDFAGIDPETSALARHFLADQLAVAFRGCVSFWVAGEIADGALDAVFQAIACTLLLGLAAPARRATLIRQLDTLRPST